MTELLGGLGGVADLAADRTRTGKTLLTDPEATDVWDSVRVQVMRYLRSRGVGPADADDLAQEVALRAIDREITYVDTDELVSWCIVVARNLHTDSTRRLQSTSSLEDVRHRASKTDIATTVEHQIALREVLREFRALSPADQGLLLADRAADGIRTKQETTRLAVRRHRIRARLAKVAVGLLGGGGVLAVRTQRMVTYLAPAAACYVVLGLSMLPLQVTTHEGSTPTVSGLHLQRQILTSPVKRSPARVAMTHAGRPVGSAKPLAAKVAPAAAHTVTVNPDGQHPVYVDRREAASSDHVICVDHVPTLPTICAG